MLGDTKCSVKVELDPEGKMVKVFWNLFDQHGIVVCAINDKKEDVLEKSSHYISLAVGISRDAEHVSKFCSEISNKLDCLFEDMSRSFGRDGD